ncbi:MAG: hypothetical protein ACTSQJ_06115 [Promethearchaeota archaeon]
MDEYDEIVKQIDVFGNKFEVAVVKEFDPIDFTIDVEANQATPYNLNDNSLRFANDYCISQIQVLSETNGLAGFLLDIAGKLIPSTTYFLDESNELATQPLGIYSKGFRCTTLLRRYQQLNIYIHKGDLLKFYVYNTHTEAQEIYITFIGFRVFKKILKSIS